MTAPLRDARCLFFRTALALGAALAVTGCGIHRQAATTSPQPPAAKPPTRTLATTVESTDPQLSAALLQAVAVPTAASYRRVGREYRRLGIRDQASEYFSKAIRLEPADAVSYEALARIWRDWGTPQMGLADAYRAVHYAPQSPSAANTLGTLLQAMGYVDEARQWYSRALTLDPQAWYALNNLCYAAIMARQQAVPTCQAAVSAAPDQKTARNNLALAHAAAGDLDAADKWFRRAGDTAEAHYNYGITLMARREYTRAIEEFARALALDPQFTQAVVRAQQARALVAAEDDRP